MNDFAANEARKEVEGYVAFLPDIEKFCRQECGKGLHSFAKIAKANCLLLLYSYIESTVSNAIRFIQDEITANSIRYPHLSDKVRNAWIKDLFLGMHLEDVSHSNYAKKITTVANSIANENAVQFSLSAPSAVGNIDFDRLKRICELWGIPLNLGNFQEVKSTIDWITEERNNLAHGNKTFEECGRDITYEQLAAAAEITTSLMTAFCDAVRQYQLGKKYLQKSLRGDASN